MKRSSHILRHVSKNSWVSTQGWKGVNTQKELFKGLNNQEKNVNINTQSLRSYESNPNHNFDRIDSSFAKNDKLKAIIDHGNQLNDKAFDFFQEGKLLDALVLFQDCKDYFQENLPKNHILLAQALNNYGDCIRQFSLAYPQHDYATQQQLEYASRCFQRGIKILEAKKPVSNSLLSNLYNNYGLFVLYNVKQQRTGIEWLKKGFLLRKTLVQDYQSKGEVGKAKDMRKKIAISLNNMALGFSILEDYSRAKDFIEKSIALFDHSIIEEHKDAEEVDDVLMATKDVPDAYIGFLNNYGDILQKMGDDYNAMIHLERALRLNTFKEDVKRTIRSKDGKDIEEVVHHAGDLKKPQMAGSTLSYMAQVFYEQDKFPEAEKALRVAISAITIALPVEHINVINLKTQLGHVILKQEDTKTEEEKKEAEELIREAKRMTHDKINKVKRDKRFKMIKNLLQREPVRGILDDSKKKE